LLYFRQKKREANGKKLRAFYTFIALETIPPRCNQLLRNSSSCILAVKWPVFGKMFQDRQHHALFFAKRVYGFLTMLFT
jgi:hypothetical protein